MTTNLPEDLRKEIYKYVMTSDILRELVSKTTHIKTILENFYIEQLDSGLYEIRPGIWWEDNERLECHGVITWKFFSKSFPEGKHRSVDTTIVSYHSICKLKRYLRELSSECSKCNSKCWC